MVFTEYAYRRTCQTSSGIPLPMDPPFTALRATLLAPYTFEFMDATSLLSALALGDCLPQQRSSLLRAQRLLLHQIPRPPEIRDPPASITSPQSGISEEAKIVIAAAVVVVAILILLWQSLGV